MPKIADTQDNSHATKLMNCGRACGRCRCYLSSKKTPEDVFVLLGRAEAPAARQDTGAGDLKMESTVESKKQPGEVPAVASGSVVAPTSQSVEPSLRDALAALEAALKSSKAGSKEAIRNALLW